MQEPYGTLAMYYISQHSKLPNHACTSFCLDGKLLGKLKVAARLVPEVIEVLQ